MTATQMVEAVDRTKRPVAGFISRDAAQQITADFPFVRGDGPNAFASPDYAGQWFSVDWYIDPELAGDQIRVVYEREA